MIEAYLVEVNTEKGYIRGVTVMGMSVCISVLPRDVPELKALVEHLEAKDDC